MPARTRNVKSIKSFKRIWGIAVDPNPLPARAGYPLQRSCHTQRMHGTLPNRRRTMHRLLRAGRRRRRLRREADRILCIRDRQRTTRRRSSAILDGLVDPRGNSIGSIWRVRCCTLPSGLEEKGVIWHNESRLTPSPAWKATARSRSSSTSGWRCREHVLPDP